MNHKWSRVKKNADKYHAVEHNGDGQFITVCLRTIADNDQFGSEDLQNVNKCVMCEKIIWEKKRLQ